MTEVPISDERAVMSRIPAYVALAMFANLTALLVEMVMLGQPDGRDSGEGRSLLDAWTGFAVAMWIQAALNGLILLAWPRTARVGAGILVGTAASVIAVGVWLFLVAP